MDQGHVGHVLHRERRFQGRVPPSDDEDPLSFARLHVGHPVEEPLALELHLARLVDLPRLEGATAGRDDHAPRLVFRLGGGHADQVLLLVAPDHRHVLALVDLRAHVIRLIDEVLSEVLAHDVGIGRVVVDRFLGVEGSELTARHRGIEKER